MDCLCKFGFHSWNNCICKKCGRTRNRSMSFVTCRKCKHRAIPPWYDLQRENNAYLHEVIRNGCLKVIKKILAEERYSYWVPQEDTNVFHIASGNGRKDILNFLLKQFETKRYEYLNMEVKGYRNYPPLGFAIINHHLSLSKILLENGALATTKKFCGILETVKNIDNELEAEKFIQLLLKYNGNVSTRINHNFNNKYGLLSNFEVDTYCHQGNPSSALTYAIDKSFKNVVRLLLGAGVDKINRNVALRFAAISNNIEMVKILLEYDVDINNCDACGETALMKALHVGNSKIALELITRGADVNAQNNRSGSTHTGRTSLILAVNKNLTEVVQVMLKNGADPNKQRHGGEKTPLMIAAKNGYVDIVRDLLTYGANINKRRKPGNFGDCYSALDYAIIYEQTDIVKILLDAGADYSQTYRNNNCCCSPLIHVFDKMNFSIMSSFFDYSIKASKRLTLCKYHFQKLKDSKCFNQLNFSFIKRDDIYFIDKPSNVSLEDDSDQFSEQGTAYSIEEVRLLSRSLLSHKSENSGSQNSGSGLTC